MEFEKLGLHVRAFQFVGAVMQGFHRYPPYSWIVTGWFEREQVVMRDAEFRKTFGNKDGLR